MKTITTHGTFEQAFAASSRQVREIARALRQLIGELYPPVVEVPWPNQGLVGYGVGPKKMSEHYCYIAAQRDYANLGFYYGAVLPDPQGLLEGSGKQLRHIKVQSLEETDRPEVRRLLMSALAERKKANDLAE